jgi:hypothetical protein
MEHTEYLRSIGKSGGLKKSGRKAITSRKNGIAGGEANRKKWAEKKIKKDLTSKAG